MRVVSAAEAASTIAPGNRVYLHGGAASPLTLLDALVARASELQDVEIVHLHTDAPAPYVAPEMAPHFRHNALFIGPNVREAVARGQADYTPVFLSEIPSLFRHGAPLQLDAALLQVAPPDESGNLSLGVSVDCALAAAHAARTVIAQVNANMPVTRGSSLRPEEVDFAVFEDRPLPTHESPPGTAESAAIGRHVAALIEDGVTIQVGIGAIPNAVLAALSGHRDLGVHTEMFSDGLLPLIESGVVTGARKTIHRGNVVTAFTIGSRRLYDFVDENDLFRFLPVNYVNDVSVIASNHAMTAINAALSIDLTGQVVADSLGHRFYSGIGGQVDFVRGAARSPRGRPIIALPSTAKDGSISRICATLPPGSGVVTTRGDVHWVVTEFGAADLHGRTIRERARLLIDLAHPDFRAGLEDEAGRLGFLRAR